mmetsp:Transcript_20973/g.60123  ORF Transcript_20973/g.60123 Transcript_20973/m.60123 type:complete len:808 (-) Transcript_20973:135-2558(-)
MLTEEAGGSSPRGRLVFTPAKRTSLAEAAAAVFSSPPISAPPSDVIPTNPVTPTSDLLRHEIAGTTSNDPPTVHVPAVEQGVATVTPSASKETHTQATAPTKALCSVAGCAKLGGYRNGKCQRHFNDDLASNERRSKRRPKRSKVDIMEEFEAKGEIPHAARHLKQKPSSIDKSQPKSLPPKTKKSDWREATDESSGKPYYYHVGTKEVTWDKPACLAAQDDQRPKKDNKDKCITQSNNGSSRGKWKVLQGVSAVPSGKFQAQTKFNGKMRYIGSFKTAEEASYAYKSVKTALDAKKNKPGVDLSAVFKSAKAEAVEALRMISSQRSSNHSDTSTGTDHARQRKIASTNPFSFAPKSEVMPRGVSAVPSGKFQAQTKFNGKMRYIGSFKTAEEASYAYKSVKTALDAKKNKPGVDLSAVFKSAKAEAVEALRMISSQRSSNHSDTSTGTDHARQRKIASTNPFSFAPKSEVMPRGVRKKLSGKYEAQIQYCGKKKYIGTFCTIGEAAAAFAVVRKTLDEVSSFDRGDAWFDRLRAEGRKAAEKAAVKVGTRIGIYWELDKVYYPATVTVMTSKNCATVLYDDGYVDNLDFLKEEFKILPTAPGAISITTPAKKATTSSAKNDTSASAVPFPFQNANPSSAKKAQAVRPKGHQCHHCGRDFTMEGLQYHLKKNVCLKGFDTSKRAPPPTTVTPAPWSASRVVAVPASTLSAVERAKRAIAAVPSQAPSPVKKAKRIKLKDHQCDHCGRAFTMEGLQYHLKHKVCFKGSDTSKKAPPSAWKKQADDEKDKSSANKQGSAFEALNQIRFR